MDTSTLKTVIIKEMHIDSVLLIEPPDDWVKVVGAMKPGAHLLLIIPIKEHHTHTIRAEDSGLEIRDTVAWVFADGEEYVEMMLITVARKPLEGTVADNVLKWGTGGLNIDKCRVEHVTVDGGNLALNPHLRSHINGGNGGHIISTETERRIVTPNAAGRWPANLTHDNSPSVVAMFPDAKGGCGNGNAAPGVPGSVTPLRRGNLIPRNDSGSAARFFYSVPCENSREIPALLISYLLKLITPYGGTVLTNCGSVSVQSSYKSVMYDEN